MAPLRAPAIAGAVLLALASRARADVHEVGPGKAFQRIEDALRRARPGDAILVHPLPDGGAYAKVALMIHTPRLTIRGLPGKDGRRVRIDGTGFDYSGAADVPRAIVQFEPEANGCVLEGFDLANAHNRSANGAGVRINQASDVTIRNCDLHHNDMGIMSGGEVARGTGRNQRLESCAFHHNGNEKRAGYNHNLYLGGTSVRMTGCEVYAPTTGHNFKSRAHFNWIEASYIHDSANREFDLVDASGATDVPDSHAILVGNVIVKAKDCRGNKAVLHFGQDGKKDHQGTLYLVHNTIITPYLSPVTELSAPGASAVIANNLVWDGGARQAGQALVSVRNGAALDRVTGGGNWLSPGFPLPPGSGLAPADNVIANGGEAPALRNPPGHDYQLLAAMPGRMLNIGRPLAAIKLPSAPGEPNPPAQILQYRHLLQTEPRAFAGPPDAGAYEAK